MLYTAQYRYSGPDRLDITVKGNCPAGKLYAPTWSIVRGIKAGVITEAEYSEQYYKLLIQRWENEAGKEEMLRMVKMTKDEGRDITVVCFCAPATFCHRYLLVKFMDYNFQVPYGGER
jgi:hypothetical protein